MTQPEAKFQKTYEFSLVDFGHGLDLEEIWWPWPEYDHWGEWAEWAE